MFYLRIKSSENTEVLVEVIMQNSIFVWLTMKLKVEKWASML